VKDTDCQACWSLQQVINLLQNYQKTPASLGSTTAAIGLVGSYVKECMWVESSAIDKVAIGWLGYKEGAFCNAGRCCLFKRQKKSRSAVQVI
jgi:hypothetical protein